MAAIETTLNPTIAEDRTRDLGCLWVTKNERRARLPLAGVRIGARVADRVAHVTLEQKFHNPFPESLEATYIFPMSGGSAVSAFELKVGSRLIKGIVKERGEARWTYQNAIQDGKRAALLEQDRDDLFTVQVGNLPPGEEVSVRIVTSERLPFFEDGTTEIRLPLVVAPRYIPGTPVDRSPVGDGIEWDTDQVPDASRISPPRLAHGFDPRIGLQIEVELAESRDFSELACSQHAIRMSGGKVALTKQDELLDRDFILRWRLAGENVRTSLLVTPGGYGMLSILPPRREGFLGLARDVIFVLDRSGSMGGVKMTSAARACSLLLRTLGPRDRFAITAFDDCAEWFAQGGFTPADEAGLAAGEKFLRTIDARGGTELDPALKETLELIGRRKDAGGRVPVVVLLTDGQVGNESAVFARLQKEGGDARIFTVGIDTAVNAAFLKRVASLGGGTCTCVVPGEALEDALRGIGREIGAPLVVDVKVDGADELAPARVPDLFAGRAATVFFRIQKGKNVTVTGIFADGKAFRESVRPRSIELPAIDHLWARARVADLEDRFRLDAGGQDEIRKEILTLAIHHTLLTRFTSFVVVDESEIVNQGGEGRRVVQPVQMPAQWEMEDQERDSSLLAARGGVGAGSGAATSASFRSPPSAPAPKAGAPPAARSRSQKLFSGLSRHQEAEPTRAPEEKPVSTSERKAFEKAVLPLTNALTDARAALSAGRIPPVGPLDQARKALLQVLGASALGTSLSALQRLLRTGLLELVAALASAGPAEIPSLSSRLDRCLSELREAVKPGSSEPKFWEKMV